MESDSDGASNAIVCSQSIILSGEYCGQDLPLAMCNDFIAVVSPSRPTVFHVYSITDGRELSTFSDHPSAISSLCFGNDCNTSVKVASACGSAVNVRSLSDDGSEANCKLIGKELGAVSHMVFAQDDVNVIICIDNELWIIDSETSELIATIPVSGGRIITCAVSQADPNLIVSVGEERIYAISDANEKSQLYQSCIISASSSLCALGVHPTETLFAVGGTDGMVRVFDTGLRNAVHEFNTASIVGKMRGDDDEDVGCSVIALAYHNDQAAQQDDVIRDVLSEKLYLIVACTSCVLLLNANSMEVLSLTFYDDIAVQNPAVGISSVASVAIHSSSDGSWRMAMKNLFGNELHICSLMKKLEFLPSGVSVLSLEPLSETSPLKAEMQLKPKPPNSKSKNTSKQKANKMNQPLVFHNKVKSSGYFNEKPRSMFQPKTNKPKGKANYSNNVGPWGLKTTEARQHCDGKGEEEYPMNSSPPTNLRSEQDLSVNASTINSLSFSGSGKSLMCGLAENTVLLLKVPSMKSTAFTGHNGSVKTCSMNRANNYLISSSEDCTVKIWSPQETAPVLELTHYKRNCGDEETTPTSNDNFRFTKQVSGAQFYYNDKFILMSHGNSLLLYKYFIDLTKDDVQRYRSNTRYKLVKDFEINDCQKITTFAAINSFYSYVAICACSNRALVVFDMNKSETVLTIPDSHTRPAHNVCQNQGSMFVTQTNEAYDLFLTNAINDGVKLWDLRLNRCVRKFDGHVNRAHNVGLSYSPCARFVAVGSEDKSTYIYDIRMVSYLHRLTGQNDAVMATAFHPQYPMLASGSLSGKLSMYDVK